SRPRTTQSASGMLRRRRRGRTSLPANSARARGGGSGSRAVTTPHARIEAMVTDMAKTKGQDKNGGGTIALNKRARHEYHIDEHYEAGIALEGWEGKSLRAGRLNLGAAYAIVKAGEIFLFGASIVPLISASTHVVADDRRTRKLLLNRAEIDKLVGAIERKGYTLVPLALYWKQNRVKVDLGLARGKQEHDKRETEKERDWHREEQ